MLNYFKKLSAETDYVSPELDQDERDAIKGYYVHHLLKEQCVIWEGEFTTSITITKSIGNINIAHFLDEILDNIHFTCRVFIDFHGFYKNEYGPFFAWGSQNSSMIPHGENILSPYAIDNFQKILDRFSDSYSNLLHSWFENHIDIMGYEDSDFTPYSIVSLVVNIQALNTDLRGFSALSSSSDDSSE